MKWMDYVCCVLGIEAAQVTTHPTKKMALCFQTLICPDNVDRAVQELVQLAEQKGKTLKSNSGQG